MDPCDCTHAGAGSPEGFVWVHRGARLTPWGGNRICAYAVTRLREGQERVPPASPAYFAGQIGAKENRRWLVSGTE